MQRSASAIRRASSRMYFRASKIMLASSNAALGCWGRMEVSMADLPEAINPEHKALIDTVGWLFLAFAVVITATAAVIVYKANDTMVANAPVSHVVAR